MGTDAYSLTFWELMSRYLNNILLALLWTALTGSFTLVNFALGLLLGWLALYLVREQLGTRRGHFRGGRILSLAVLFIKELILSGWRVARLVTSRGWTFGRNLRLPAQRTQRLRDHLAR